MRYRILYFLVSALVLVPGVVALGRWGLKLSIDFTGGALWEFSLKGVDRVDRVRQVFAESGVELSFVDKKNDIFKVGAPDLPSGQRTEILATLKEKFGSVEELGFENIGPALGKELIKKTVIAIILAAGFILFYVAWRFKDKMYGVCAILAMFHDTLILLGSFAILGHYLGVEVDSLFVTAVLTILSFSVHDTVVVYDKIRESVRVNPKVDYEDQVNKAVAETLTRSVNNSLTIIFMLLALVLLGGETIKWFVVALLIGTIAGTYSSTFTAAPLLVVWHKLSARK